MTLRRQTAYGMDASASHLVIARAGRGGVEILISQSAPQIDASLRAQIEQDVASGRAVTSAAMPCHETVMRRLTAPFDQWSRAEKVLPSLFDVQLPFPLESCSYTFVGAARAPGSGFNALGIAARREDLARLIETLDIVNGVDPVLLDHEGLALWQQAVIEHGVAPDAGRVFVHLGPQHTTLVYGRGREMLGAHGTRGAADIASAQTVAARIQTWLAAQSALPVTPRTEWMFSGAGAARQPLVDALKIQAGVSTVTTVRDPATFLARALAQRAAANVATSCNLRTGALAHPVGARVQRNGARRLHVLAMAASLALIASNAAALWYAAHRNESLQTLIQQKARAITGAPAPRGQELLVVQRSLDDDARKLFVVNEHIRPATSRRVGELLTLCRTNGATVSRLNYSAGLLRVELTPAHAPGALAIEQALRSDGWKLQSQKLGELTVLEGTR